MLLTKAKDLFSYISHISSTQTPTFALLKPQETQVLNAPISTFLKLATSIGRECLTAL